MRPLIPARATHLALSDAFAESRGESLDTGAARAAFPFDC